MPVVIQVNGLTKRFKSKRSGVVPALVTLELTRTYG